MSRRKGEPMETPEYSVMLERMIVRYGVRCSDGDDVDLGRMLEVRAALDEAIGVAVRAQADRNSWSYVACGLGMARQSAYERFRSRRRRGTPPEPGRTLLDVLDEAG